MDFVRFESAQPNHRGAHIGIFGLANGLRSANRLSEVDRRWLAINNAHGNAAYANPAAHDATLFDRSIHPHATCWFKATAVDLLDYTVSYLELLTRYGVAWRRRDADDPGVILYEDEVQVVVEPKG
jgi:hypothetical protein